MIDESDEVMIKLIEPELYERRINRRASAFNVAGWIETDISNNNDFLEIGDEITRLIPGIKINHRYFYSVIYSYSSLNGTYFSVRLANRKEYFHIRVDTYGNMMALANMRGIFTKDTFQAYGISKVDIRTV